jgi:hypothetical protein
MKLASLNPRLDIGRDQSKLGGAFFIAEWQLACCCYNRREPISCDANLLGSLEQGLLHRLR